MDTQEWPAQRFEEHRTHPHAVAYKTPVISGGDEAWYRLNVAGRVIWRLRRGLFGASRGRSGSDAEDGQPPLIARSIDARVSRPWLAGTQARPALSTLGWCKSMPAAVTICGVS